MRLIIFSISINLLFSQRFLQTDGQEIIDGYDIGARGKHIHIYNIIILEAFHLIRLLQKVKWIEAPPGQV